MAKAKKEIAKLNNSTALTKAVDAHFNYEVGQTKEAANVYRNYLLMCERKEMTVDNAREVLERLRAKIVAHREKQKDKRPVPQVEDSRVSEFKSILRMHTYACWRNVMDTIESADTSGKKRVAQYILAVSKFVRGKTKAGKANVDAQAKTVPAERIRTLMQDAKAKKSPARTKNASKKGTKYTSRAAIDKAIASMKRNATGIKTWFNGDASTRMVDAMLTNLATLSDQVAKVAEKRAAE